jgi:Zn-dependent protease with chaperone function
MDFFTAQTRARAKTRRLVVLFILAVLGVATGIYAVVMLALWGFDAKVGTSLFSPHTPQFWDTEIALWTFLGTGLLVGGASLYKWATLGAGGPAVAEMMGGRHVSPLTQDAAERRLVNVVEEMALASGVPVPRIYILDSENSINAFAAGLTTGDAVVAVSRGALWQLSRDELQAVVGHEFSHILNGDMRLNLKLTAILFGILALTIIGRVLLRSGGVRTSGNGKNKGNILPLVGLGILLAGYLGFFFGRLIQAAVSRQREFLADASSVQFTRNPDAMAGALNRIRASSSLIADPRAGEISHFFFAQSFGGFFAGLFATHPPLEERIRAVAPTFNFANPPRTTRAATTAATAANNTSAAAGFANAPTAAGFAPSATSPLAPHNSHNSPNSPNSHPPHNSHPTAASSPSLRRTSAAALAGIGSLDSERIHHAGHLLDQLPPALHHAAHDPAQVSALILGLLLDTANPDVYRRQIATLGNASFSSALLDALAALDPLQRLPLLQVALGSLSAFAPAQQDHLAALAEKLAAADGRVSIFEYALLRLLKHHLANLRNPRRAATPRTIAQHDFADATSTVLSFLAYAGQTAGQRPETAFAAGARAFPDTTLALLSDRECNFRRLDTALALLADASPSRKKQLLTAAAETVSADGLIEPGEAELLRAISASLDCPMPPLY